MNKEELEKEVKILNKALELVCRELEETASVEGFYWGGFNSSNFSDFYNKQLKQVDTEKLIKFNMNWYKEQAKEN